MTPETLLFFDGHAQALPLYAAFERRVLSEITSVRVKVQKTQISFYNRHLFACVSFLPLGSAAVRPEPYLTVSFGLGWRLNSSRIAAVTEPYPNRWTHHVLVSSEDEIDEEFMTWIREASVFSAAKR